MPGSSATGSTKRQQHHHQDHRPSINSCSTGLTNHQVQRRPGGAVCVRAQAAAAVDGAGALVGVVVARPGGVHLRGRAGSRPGGCGSWPRGPPVARTTGGRCSAARAARHDPRSSWLGLAARRHCWPASACLPAQNSSTTPRHTHHNNTHLVAVQQVLQAVPQLLGHVLVAVRHQPVEGGVDVDGAVASHHHPGSHAAIHGSQVALDEAVLLAARLKQVLCGQDGRRTGRAGGPGGGGERAGGSGSQVNSAGEQRHAGVPALHATRCLLRRTARRCAGRNSRQERGPPVLNWQKWMGPKSKLYQGLSSAGVGMRVRR